MCLLRQENGPHNAQQGLGVGLGWLYGAASAPPMFML
jgi:hypothetical protein